MDFSFDITNISNVPDMTKRNRADDVIDLLIEQVLSVYPPERLERIKSRSEASWKDIKNMENMGKDCAYNDRISYVVLNYNIIRSSVYGKR